MRRAVLSVCRKSHQLHLSSLLVGRYINEILHVDQTRGQEMFYRVMTVPPTMVKTFFVTGMTTRDLFAIANCVVNVASECIILWLS